MGVLDEIKAISAQLGLGFGRSLAKTRSAATVIGIYSHFGGVHSRINGDHLNNGDSLMDGDHACQG